MCTYSYIRIHPHICEHAYMHEQHMISLYIYTYTYVFTYILKESYLNSQDSVKKLSINFRDKES